MRNKLSATKCEKETKPGRYNDGGGLYLVIQKSTRTPKDGELPGVRKTWSFRWRDRRTGRLREKGLGVFGKRDVSLDEARDLAGDYRQIVRDGGDPIEECRRKRQALLADLNRNKTFGWCAEQYIAAHEAGWTNPKHVEQWRSTLDTYAARLKAMPVSAIDTPEVLSCLRPIWETKNETASRVRQRIEKVLGWARVSGFREGDNPARWKNHLENLLAKPSKVKKVKHHSALHYDQVGDFMARLKRKKGFGAEAVEFLILTATRVGEVAAARWEEIDLDKKTWTIPAERMKANKEHVVPLSTQAVALLESQSKSGDYLFPGRKSESHLSGASLLKTVKDLDADLTVHGFRSTFRDWAGETTAYPREVIEMALAHQLKDKAEAAYARGNLLEKRRKLMKDWASYCYR
jgi:integrase